MSSQTSINGEQVNKVLRDVQKTLSSLSMQVERQNKQLALLEAAVYVTAADSVTNIKQPAKVKSKPSVPVMSLEERLGGNWFAKIGIAALVIGVAFFLKYAFDNDWIGETGRIVLGMVIGVGLVIVGERLLGRFFLYAQLLFGGGLIILYLSLFAAFSFYHLIGYATALVIMATVTALGIVASVRHSAPVLIGTAMLGGFVTPFLLWSGGDNQLSVFAFVLLLDIAIAAVTTMRPWRLLNLLSFIGTSIVFMAWYLAFYDASQLIGTIVWLTLFFIVYSFSTVAHNVVQESPSTGSEQLLTFAAAAAYFGQCYIMLAPRYEEFLGFFALMLALYYLCFAYGTRRVIPQDDSLYDFLAALAVAFVTLAVPLQFDRQLITIGWSVEVVMLIVIALKTRKNALRKLSAIVAGVAAVRLLFFETVATLNNPLLFLNQRFFVFMFSAAAFYVGGWLCLQAYRSADTDIVKKWWQSFAAGLVLTANLVTIVAGSQEIVEYYAQKERVVHAQIAEMQSANYSASWLVSDTPPYRAAVSSLESLGNQSSIVLSLFWLVYGIAVVVVGFARNSKLVRLGGISLLSLAVLKLFFYDLWNLGTLYRIISSISLGIVLLAISFAYQRFKHLLKELL